MLISDCFHANNRRLLLSRFPLKNTECAKINFAFLSGHGKSYAGPILKTYELVFGEDSQLNASILHILWLFIHEAIREFTKILDLENTENGPKALIKLSNDSA